MKITKITCDRCQGPVLERRSYTQDEQVTEYVEYRCQNCGAGIDIRIAHYNDDGAPLMVGGQKAPEPVQASVVSERPKPLKYLIADICWKHMEGEK